MRNAKHGEISRDVLDVTGADPHEVIGIDKARPALADVRLEHVQIFLP